MIKAALAGSITKRRGGVLGFDLAAFGQPIITNVDRPHQQRLYAAASRSTSDAVLMFWGDWLLGLDSNQGPFD